MSIELLRQPLLSAQERMEDSPTLHKINAMAERDISGLYTKFLNWKDLSVYASVEHQTRELVDTETEKSLAHRKIKIVENVQGPIRDTAVQFSDLSPGQKRAIVHGEEVVINHYGCATQTIACCFASVKNSCECVLQIFNKKRPNYVTVSDVVTQLTTHLQSAPPVASPPVAPPPREEMEE